MNLERISYEAEKTPEGLNEVLELTEKLKELPELFEDVEKANLRVYYENGRIVLECLDSGYIFSGKFGYDLNITKPNEYLFEKDKDRFKVIIKD